MAEDFLDSSNDILMAGAKNGENGSQDGQDSKTLQTAVQSCRTFLKVTVLL